MPSTDIKDYWRRSWGIGDRQPFAEAGLADPANNIVKGQDLGTGIQQRLKFGKIKYVTSAVEDTILKEHNNYKDAKAFRETLIEKYKIGEPKPYEGKYNYKELIKDKAFEKFWKAKVDAINTKGADSILQGIGTREALQKVINEHNLKPNDYEGIFNKVLEETRITEAVRKGKGKPGQKRLVSAQILSNLMRTFEDAYKPTLGTIDTKTMSKLLKLPEGELEKLMTFMNKSIPAETAHLVDSDIISRTDKAAAVKKMLNDAGITFEKYGRIGEGSRWRFKLDKDSKKFKKLEKSKTFGFVTEKPVRKYPKSYKDKFTTISRKSAEYKKMEYGKDRGAIRQLTKALNNAVKGMSDAQLLAFVNANPKIKNLVTVRFDPSSPNLFRNTPLEKMTISEIRQNLQLETDHIRGRSTVKYDAATKKILDGLNIEYPKNLYIIPKALNMSTKQRVENFVATYPNETEKIKKIDKYFKDNKISYFDRRTGTYGGAKPSKSAVDIGHLGLTKISELKKLLTGTYKDTRGKIKPITKDVDKLIAALIERNRARGGTTLIDDINKVSTAIQSIMTKKNSGLNVVDIAKWGRAELSALDDIAGKLPSKALSAFGKILKFAGVMAIPLDAVPFTEAHSTGLTPDVGAMNLAEMYSNLPGMIWEAGEWVASKVQGKKHEWKPFYEFEFGRDYETKKLQKTPLPVLEKRVDRWATDMVPQEDLEQVSSYLDRRGINVTDNNVQLQQYEEELLKRMREKKALADQKKKEDNLTGVDQYIINRHR